MHLDIAYSLEWKDFITAEEAYDLYWSGLIKDKRAFQCPEDGCDGQVTCANMDKPEQSLKLQPHFRPYSHSEGCPLLEQAKAREQEGETEADGTTAGMGEDVFMLQRPANHEERAQVALTDGGGRATTGNAPASRRYTGPTRRQLFSVRSLVTRWAKHRQKGTDAEATVSVGDATAVPYHSLFESIFPNRKTPVLEQPRVYWGKAWVSELKNGDYRIAFHSPMTLQDEEGNVLGHEKPAVFVDKTALENYRVKRLLEPQLHNAAKDKKPVLAFVYATPVSRTTKNEKHGERTFINFDIDNLDMLCLHPVSFFEELKREA